MGKVALILTPPGVLPVEMGGTGNAKGTVAKLTTARTIRTNLGSTAAASFDGSGNVTPGVTGVLPVANGGTGAKTMAEALASLGAVRIETGSYVGSGSSEKSLTFSFAPKLVAILCAVEIEYEDDSEHRRLTPYFGSVPGYNWSGASTMIPQALHTSYWTNEGGFGSWYSSQTYDTRPFGRVSSNGKTVYWKNASDMNRTTTRYHYLAIG